MATRKDLLKAQSFISRRMVAAFVDRDPDDPTPPLRRVGVASFVSVLLGVILLAGTALIGMLRPGTGGDSWQEEGVIISDTSAGMLFVYSEGRLAPMSNVASARLWAGGKDADGPPRVVKVSTEALRGAEQLPMHGIPGAPRQLPAAGDVAPAPLRLCSAAPNTVGDRFITLELGAPAREGEPGAFVAEDSHGDQFLIAGGRAHELWRLKGRDSPLKEGLPVVSPGSLWLSALPVGEPIVPLDIPEEGATPSNSPLGLRIGQLAKVEEVEGDTVRYYVQLEAGLSRISYLDMRLIQETRGAGEPTKISESEFSAASNDDIPVSGNSEIDPGKPQPPAGFSNLADVSLCATFSAGDNDKVTLSIGDATPDMPREQRQPHGNVIDLIDTDPLSGVLLTNANNPVEEAATFLVMDGHSYPIPDLPSRRALGYGDVAPVPVPPQLISAIPPGLASGSSLSMDQISVSE